jgi:hypothetical protein
MLQLLEWYHLWEGRYHICYKTKDFFISTILPNTFQSIGTT